MSREQQEYYGNVRALVVVGFGCAGSCAGVVLPVTDITTFGFSSMLHGALLGIFFGFPIGAFCGLLLSWAVGTNPTDEAMRLASQGPQLVGQTCVFCSNHISSILEGDFCRDCHSPSHFKCRRESTTWKVRDCPQCGAEPSDE